MKKTLVSLATASLLASGAMAADKGIDIVTTGQAAVYYETNNNNGVDGTDGQLFDKDSSQANVGIQLNLDADLKNNFTFGSQLTYLGTAGLEGNLVSGIRQNVNSVVGSNDIADQIALTKIFIAKKISNTTVKVGRQELPKSLSPLAFSESWNVFKNTFEAILAVNTDIPDTTLVGAYVSAGNTAAGDITAFNNVSNDTDGTGVTSGGAYMATVVNKSIPMTTITATYYDIAKVVGADGVSATWFDAAIAGKDLPMGLKIGLQGGTIMTDTATYSDTTAYGVKVGLKPVDALALCVAYTSVDGDDNKLNVAMRNVFTANKTPLYTQMIANQGAIAVDANTFLLKGVYNLGDAGKIIAQGTMTTAGESNLQNAGRDADGTDYTELELIYKVKAGGVNFLAAYVNRDWSEKNANDMDNQNLVRVVARYNF